MSSPARHAPTKAPVSISHGVVKPVIESPICPSSARPMVGRNIRQVVEPISLSNKITVERCGGVSFGDLEVLIYFFIVSYI